MCERERESNWLPSGICTDMKKGEAYANGEGTSLTGSTQMPANLAEFWSEIRVKWLRIKMHAP